MFTCNPQLVPCALEKRDLSTVHAPKLFSRNLDSSRNTLKQNNKKKRIFDRRECLQLFNFYIDL